MSLIEATGIHKTYSDTARPVEVLRGVDFSMSDSEVCAIYGASGSGKSTLLHILGGLDEPTVGHVRICGEDLTSLRSDDAAKSRNGNIGFVFQFYHLLGEFTALENVMLPVLIHGESRSEAREMAEAVLESMGLSERLDHRPAMLSGGEQQRVALARAAVMKPKVIFADEPTGNLDNRTGRQVWKYLLDLNDKNDIALVIVTHNRELAGEVGRVLELEDGIIRTVTGERGASE